MDFSRKLCYSLDDIEQAALGTEDPNPLHSQRHHTLACQNSSPNRIFSRGPIVLGFQIATLIDTEIRALDYSMRNSRGHGDVDYLSSSYDIRYLRPAYSGETMCVSIKTALHAQQEGAGARPDRILLVGESGSTARGLRSTSVEQIETQGAFDHCGLYGRSGAGTNSGINGFHHQRKQIDLLSGARFLNASLGTNLKRSATDRQKLLGCLGNKDDLRCRLPRMYPVALSSSALARCPLFADINLTTTQLVYTRIRLHINNAVTDNIKDGDFLDYWAGNAELSAEQTPTASGKSVVHVVACTHLKELVFWGTFTLSHLCSQDTNPAPSRRKSGHRLPELAET